MKNLTHLLLLLASAAAMMAQSFVPDSFTPPATWEASAFKLVPLGPGLARVDYEAYMSSIDHLRQTFGSGRWPHEKLTMEDAEKDVKGEMERFLARKSFTYAVLSPDGQKELGCVYIRPSSKRGYDAQVAMWVTKEQFDQGFDARLFGEVKQWLAAKWPFQKVAYPKREISEAEWQALPAR